MKRLSYVFALWIGFSALPVQAATLSATKTVAGQFTPGTQVTYTIVISNTGTAQGDNLGDEFTDTLPFSLFSITANATSGTASVIGNTITWNGSIAAGGSVTITITAT